MATPLKPFWPCQIAWYPIFSNSSAGKASSAHLISCRQATAGRRSSSHSISRGRRALVPLMLKDAIRIPWVLDAEAGTATATRGGVRILDLERRAAERFDEIDRAPFDQLEAHRIDDQLHAVRFAHGVPGLRRVGQVELVLEARAATALDREAQDSRAALLARDRVHAGRCRFGKGKRFSHACHVGTECIPLKRCECTRASRAPLARPARAGSSPGRRSTRRPPARRLRAPAGGGFAARSSPRAHRAPSSAAPR